IMSAAQTRARTPGARGTARTLAQKTLQCARFRAGRTVPAPRGGVSRLRPSALALHCGADLREVVEAVPHRVILEEELARERRIPVHRVGSNAVEIRLRDGAERGCRRRGILLYQGDRFRLADAVEIARVLGVDGVHVVPRDVIDDAAAGQLLRQPDLERVHAGHMMHHDADLAAVVRNRRLPVRVAQSFGERDQGGGALLEHGSESFGSTAHGCFTAGTHGRSPFRWPARPAPSPRSYSTITVGAPKYKG